MFQRRKKMPIEQRNYSAYYLMFSGILFLGTMWAVVDEVATRRPWKEQQKEYYDLLDKQIRERLSDAQASLDSSTYMELHDELRAANDSLRGPIYSAAYSRYDDVLEALADETREYQFAKSRGDEAYYFYKKSMHEGNPDPDLKTKLQAEEGVMAEHQVVITKLEHQRDSLKAILDSYKQNIRNVQDKIDEVTEDVDKWEVKLRRSSEAAIEIRQVMMLDYDKNPFNDPKARIDRCQTCHMGWNEELMEDAKQPFTKHPDTELLKIHNPEVYGCTPCHRGQGTALTAGFAHGEDDHYWENPLLRGKEVYASCNECHENQSALKYAPEFTKAKQTMIESGCFGCHEIKGYTDLPRIGPELRRISYKTNPQWVYRWIKNPKEYNPHTRMPNFMLTDEEAEEATAYLVSVSGKTPFAMARGAYAGGNQQSGKELVATIGCMGCHVVDDNTKVREKRGTSYDMAPELTRAGSKINPDWVYDWIRNPRHYNPTTKMPSLRLTDSEAKDIVAYLMTLRDPRTFPEKALNLASTVAIQKGEKVIRDYGCGGCHLIPGMEKESRVSVALSNFGRKRVEEMDFGDTHVPHTWRDWITNKLKNSRVFQTDRIIQKMPVFSFSDEEIESLKIFLLSQTKDGPGEKYVEEFNKKQQNIEAGRRIAMNYNCQQCHELEAKGRYISALIDESAFLPPIITGEGKKVQEPWLHDFLANPTRVGQPNSIRPWIPIRMPTFHLTDEEITGLTKYFLGLSDQELELRDYAAYTPDPVLLPIGKQIFTDFQCLKCHPAGNVSPGEASTSDLAPNLTKARDRLKPEWIVEWLADPNKLQQGTRMPTFFPDGQSPLPDVLDGNAQKQMMAIRDYVISIGEPRRSQVASK